MKGTITEKIIRKHLKSGVLEKGKEIIISIDQTLTQDSTGTMVYLQMEAMNIEEIKTELSAAYIDHNTLQTGFENADDHAFIKSCARKYGIYLSKAGGGVCHQLHLENYAAPGKTLLGSDSHTPTCGGLCSLAIGAGGLDVALAMAEGEYAFTMPEVMGVKLLGELSPIASAKDVILYILKELTVSGGKNYIIEYFGPGVATLSVEERATITNMGAELGATSSIFPSDFKTLEFLRSHNREECFTAISAEENAEYAKVLEIDLAKIKPMVARPHSPDNVVEVSEIKDLKVQQVCIGSCTNSSYQDLSEVAAILEGKKVNPDVSLSISCGSASTYKKLADEGILSVFINAGARILENSCGPCIGMGQAPAANAVSLRTFNRNFKGRTGTSDALVYLVSPKVAAASAVAGYLTDAEEYADSLKSLKEKKHSMRFEAITAFTEEPPKKEESRQNLIKMGKNIKPVPVGTRLENDLCMSSAIKLGDNISTDDIMPSSSKLLPYRSNIPYLSDYCFGSIDRSFPERCKAMYGEGAGTFGAIIAGENYGQGSSREHAALVPLYLGIRVVLAKSFARIHRANLINAGIIPLTFMDKSEYDEIMLNQLLIIKDVRKAIGLDVIELDLPESNQKLLAVNDLTDLERRLVLAGGRLNYISGKRG